jgi:hypothetical protein
MTYSGIKIGINVRINSYRFELISTALRAIKLSKPQSILISLLIMLLTAELMFHLPIDFEFMDAGIVSNN